MLSPRKLVLSGNPIGGVTTTAKVLRDMLTTRGNRLEVLGLSSCSWTDDDMSVLCKGIVHPRCHLHTLTLANNIDLRDRGVE
ncbi:unnamed protein product, partial [Sphacelaria rigidula]